jgi:putative phosphotransacetylase
MAKIKVEISAHHLHLTKQDLHQLFGDGYELTKEKHLSQPGQFAAKEVVTLVGPDDKIDDVRIIGPCRGHTQIELARSDCFHLGIKAPLRLSGKVIRSGAIKVVGPKGELDLEEGAIVAKRHVHLSLEESSNLGLSNGQNVKVRIDGPRALTLEEVEVRVDEEFESAVHLDTDEANAAWVTKETQAEIIVD